MESSILLQEKRVTRYFRISVILKGAISLAEIAVGVLVSFVPVSFFTDALMRFAQGELVEEQGDFIATHLVSLSQQFSVESGAFIAFYLLSRGLIKLVLIIALLKNQLWAYPSSLAVLGLFVAYQAYQIAAAHSLFIVALTVFDLVVMWFIWKEYLIVRLHRQAKGGKIGV
ncbi:MAG: hypothetical protein JWL87_519 [Candidatus Adlerbacteria bacterium]|nr:hypothetical protein [Candidatus Adlerbacteria bacterium]